jgi:uncharacterized protein YcbX
MVAGSGFSKGFGVRIEHLYRYPVKGLTQEALDEIDLTPGQVFPWDRAFALAQGDNPFDPAAPRFVSKSYFMCLAQQASIALLKTRFDPHEKLLRIDAPDGALIAANPFTPDGATAIAIFLTRFLGDQARGEPYFYHVPGHNFADDDQPVISLINQASVADFEQKIGAPREPLRFRANIHLAGAAPWAEKNWLNQDFQLGQAKVRVLRTIPRCAATEVNPATGERDAKPVQELRQLYGKHHMGVYLEVLEAGRIAVGDAMEAI